MLSNERHKDRPTDRTSLNGLINAKVKSMSTSPNVTDVDEEMTANTLLVKRNRELINVEFNKT